MSANQTNFSNLARIRKVTPQSNTCCKLIVKIAWPIRLSPKFYTLVKIFEGYKFLMR
jgi:hypothetical protein